MIKVEGKGGISATVACDSVSVVDGKRIVTFEVEFPRFILSEYNTHRQHSKNAASTRAIPILKEIEQILESPAMPIFYGKNQAGMQAYEEMDALQAKECESIILEMRDYVIEKVKQLQEKGLHKQHAGRYLEPWQMVKGVLTSTEWDNFFWLRIDSAAQPEIKELAECMYKAMQQSVPEKLYPGMWHLPYVDKADGDFIIYNEDGSYVLLATEQAMKVSAARCAAVSYRKTDYNFTKSLEVYERLVGSEKKHSSAFEHQATPMYGEYSFDGVAHHNDPLAPSTWQPGITHSDKDYNLWSGNFKGWVQHRQLIDGHVCTYYKQE